MAATALSPGSAGSPREATSMTLPKGADITSAEGSYTDTAVRLFALAAALGRRPGHGRQFAAGDAERIARGRAGLRWKASTS